MGSSWVRFKITVRLRVRVRVRIRVKVSVRAKVQVCVEESPRKRNRKTYRIFDSPILKWGSGGGSRSKIGQFTNDDAIVDIGREGAHEDIGGLHIKMGDRRGPKTR